MTNSHPAVPCFLVEWYQSGPAAVAPVDAVEQLTRAAAALGPHGPPVSLVMVLNVPHDQTVFGVFHAATADAVIQACQRAGWPADRISSDVQPWPTPEPT